MSGSKSLSQDPRTDEELWVFAGPRTPSLSSQAQGNKHPSPAAVTPGTFRFAAISSFSSPASPPSQFLTDAGRMMFINCKLTLRSYRAAVMM